MTDDELRTAMRDAVLPILRGAPKEQRLEGASFIASLGYELSRGIAGNEWARGWLEAGLDDLQHNPPMVRIVEPN